MQWLPIILVVALIALAMIITGSELMLVVIAFAVVAMGAIFAATYYMNKAADSAETTGDNN